MRARRDNAVRCAGAPEVEVGSDGGGDDWELVERETLAEVCALE